MTPGRKKLAALGFDFPLFPVTLVGSLPKPVELTELKNRVQKGFQNPSDLERKQALAVQYWIHLQDKLGIDLLVDGEIDRSDLVTHFSEKISGFEPGGLVRCYGNRYYRKPIIKSKLESSGPLMADSWKATQRMTHRPLKAVLTGPYTLLDWSFNEFYSNRRSAVMDLAAIVHKEVKALRQAGAKIIQLDEPAMSSKPAEFPLVAEALRKVIHGVNAYFILHHSYGDLAPIWSKMKHLPVDNFDIETTNSGFSLLPLLKKFPTKKDLTVGIVESHRHNVETSKDVADRIRIALKYVKPEQLWFSPDCGLKTRTTEEAAAKLKLLAQTVQDIRTKKKRAAR